MRRFAQMIIVGWLAILAPVWVAHASGAAPMAAGAMASGMDEAGAACGMCQDEESQARPCDQACAAQGACLAVIQAGSPTARSAGFVPVPASVLLGRNDPPDPSPPRGGIPS